MKSIATFILFIALTVSVLSQTTYMKINDKTITTSVDTTVLTNLNFVIYEISLSNRSSTDTLQYRFDTQRGTAQDTTWATLFPSQGIHFANIFAKRLYRKAKSGSGIFSQLIAN